MCKRVLFLAILLAAGWPALAHADAKLDDDSIRALYKQQADAAMDTDKVLELMQTQLADEFTVEQKTTFDFGNGQNHTSEQAMTKAQVIDAERASNGTEKIEKFSNNIASIKYSADRQFAYVDDTTSETKTIDAPVPGGAQPMRVHAVIGAACLDTLAVMDGSIKLVRSKCFQKVMIGK